MGQNVTLVSVLFLFYTHLPVRSGGDHPIGCFRHILFDSEAERVKKREGECKRGRHCGILAGSRICLKKKGA